MPGDLNRPVDSAWKRLGWFAAIWLAGVLVVAALAQAVRLALT